MTVAAKEKKEDEDVINKPYELNKLVFSALTQTAKSSSNMCRRQYFSSC